MNDADAITYPERTEQTLSVAELRLISQVRASQRKSNGRPVMITIRIVDGVWQVFEAVPRGMFSVD